MISCHSVDILLCASSYEKLILTKYLSVPKEKISVVSYLYPESEQNLKRVAMYYRNNFAVVVNPNSIEDKLGVINFCKSTWPLISSYLPDVKLDIFFISNYYVPNSDPIEWNNSYTVFEKQLSSFNNVRCCNQTTFLHGPLWLRSKLFDYRAVLCPWNVNYDDNALTSNISSSSSISLIETLISGTPFVAYSYSMLGLPNFVSKIMAIDDKVKLSSYGGYSKDFGGIIVPSIPENVSSWDDIKSLADKNFADAAVEIYHLANLSKWKGLAENCLTVSMQNYEYSRRFPVFQRVIENLDRSKMKKGADYSELNICNITNDAISQVAKYHEEKTLEFINKIEKEKENEVKPL